MTNSFGYGADYGAGSAAPASRERRIARADEEEDRQPSTPRPNRAFVNALAIWATGRPINELVYTNQRPVNKESKPGDNITSVSVNSTGNWGPFHHEVARDMRYVRQEYLDELIGNDTAPAFPMGFNVILSNLAANKSRSSVDQVFIGDPQFSVELPHGFRDEEDGSVGHTRAELEDLFTKACYGWHNTEERNSDTSVDRDIKFNTIAYGLGYRQTVLDRSQYPEEPERKAGERKANYAKRVAQWKKDRVDAGCNVFQSKSIHPLNVVFDRAHKPPHWAIIREPIDPFTAMSDYPEWKPKDSTANILEHPPEEGAKDLVLCRYWSKDWTGCWIDEEPAIGPDAGADEEGIARNPYGFVPGWPSAGGHGHQDHQGRPEYEYQGIVRGARNDILVHDELRNDARAWVRKTSFGPQEGLTGGTIADVQTAARIKQDMGGGPGVIPWFPNGWSRDTVEPTPLPPSVMQLLDMQRQAVDEDTVYDVSAGAGTPTEPAARTRVRLQQIDRQLADAALHVEQSLEADYTARFYMIKYVLRGPVGVNVAKAGQPAKYVEVRPDDIPDGLIVKCTLIGDSEEEKARKQQLADSRLGVSLGLRGYLEMTGDPDPDQTIKDLIVDYLMETAGKPAMAEVAQGRAPILIGQAYEAEGIRYTPEEILAAQMIAQAQMGMGGAGGSMASATPGTGAPPNGQPSEVNQNGAALPGTPFENAESGVSDNPQVARPESAEADAQRGRLNQRLVPR